MHAAQQETPERPGTAPRGKPTLDPPARVLVVDDDIALAKALQRVLRLEGFHVEIAVDGPAALAQLRSAVFDVMLLDMQMANMDGLEVFQAARAASTSPATILHSAFVDVRTAVLAVRAGVKDVLQKPVPEALLSSKIRELASEQRRSAPLRESDGPSREADPPELSRLVGDSPVLVEVREQIRRVARFRDLTVLIQGPTGTGKELVAQAIHAMSAPTDPFVSLNCAAVPEHLFESELFGHEAGAFTSAKGSRAGLLEEAGAGTIFLDEVGELPLSLQAKLLRVLETRQFRRVGGNRSRVLQARVVSATNRWLPGESDRVVRPDLYFRLAGYTILTPALATHKDDIPRLARHFVSEFARRHGMQTPTLSEGALAALAAHEFPGNVRELRAVMENACIHAQSAELGAREVAQALLYRGTSPPGEAPAPQPARLPSGAYPVGAVGAVGVVGGRAEPPAALAAPGGFSSLPELQRDVILKAFEESNGNLSIAARGLGIPRSTLRDRLRKYGVR